MVYVVETVKQIVRVRWRGQLECGRRASALRATTRAESLRNLCYVLPWYTGRQAAVLYKLERGGFTFDRQELTPRPLDADDQEVLARYLCASVIACGRESASVTT